jgi:hypothetical protein
VDFILKKPLTVGALSSALTRLTSQTRQEPADEVSVIPPEGFTTAQVVGRGVGHGRRAVRWDALTEERW